MGLDEVGSHPASRSPFGVEDMAGNALEVVASAFPEDARVLRGGAYFFEAKIAHAANRVIVAPDLRAHRLVQLMPAVELQRDAFRLVWRTGHPREGSLRELAAELARLPVR